MNTLAKKLPVWLKRYLFLKRKVDFNLLSPGEMEFFSNILPLVKGVIDVGARVDTFYSVQIANSDNPDRKTFLFEANPIFASELAQKLVEIKDNNHVFNVGIGREKTDMYYYYDTQSLRAESKVGNSSQVRSKKKIEVMRLDNWISDFGVSNFLKSDIEEMDFYCLLGAGQLLSNIHFLQFELGLGMPFNGGFVENQDYWSLLEPNFHLFILRDESNPIFKTFLTLPLLLTPNTNSKMLIPILQSTGVGFNIVGIHKQKGIPARLESCIGTL